jgi:hypothetical protein
MLRKIGSAMTLRSVTKLPTKQANGVDEIIEERDPDFVYFRARAVTADVPNGNGDLFTRAELEKSYKTFIGKHVDFEHKTDPSHIVGKIIDAYPVDDPVTGEYYIEVLGKVDRKLHPEIARMVETGLLDKVSMESNVERSICSICGHTITSNDDPRCDHQMNFLGKTIDGKPVYARNEGVTFTGLGIVLNPADKRADIKNIFAKMNWNLEEMSSHLTSLTTDQKTLLKIASELQVDSQVDSQVASILNKLSAAEFLTLTRILGAEPVKPKGKIVGKVAFVSKANEDESYFIIRWGSVTLRATLKQIWKEHLDIVKNGSFQGAEKLPKGWYKDVNVWGKELLAQLQSGRETIESLAAEYGLKKAPFTQASLFPISKRNTPSKWEKGNEEARKKSEIAYRESGKGRPMIRVHRIQL